MAKRPDIPFRGLLTLALVALGLTVAGPAAAQTPATLFERAQGRAEAVRSSPAPTVAAVRTAARSFENIVRRFPTSGFSDNALFEAAVLMRQAHTLSGDKADRAAGLRYLEWLRKEYPHSPLLRQVPALATGFDPAEPAPAEVPAASPVAAARSEASEPASSGGLAVVRSVSQAALPQGERVTIELTREVPYSVHRVDGPDRVFFDFTTSAPDQTLINRPPAITGQLVKALRLGRHQANVTRVVLELAGAPRFSAFTLYEPFRLVIDVESDALAPKPVPPPVARPPINQTPKLPGAVVVPPRPVAPPPVLPAPPPPPASPPPAPEGPAESAPLPAASTARGDYSLARQLGLGVSRVVIDPGHGGHDPGAQANGISESELVLDVSLRLKRLLQQHSGIEVVLTREDNRFIPLEQRTARANQEGADLFLSIHANASRQTATRGVETYLLNLATNPSAEAVAARENATSAQSMGTLPSILRAIMTNNKLKESRELATFVQTSLVRSLRARSADVRDLGVKQAPFVVLIGAEMPSVLAEISFLTNRAEAALLKQSAYRDRIAQALCDAVLKYQASLKRGTTVASREEPR